MMNHLSDLVGKINGTFSTWPWLPGFIAGVSALPPIWTPSVKKWTLYVKGKNL